MLTLVDFLTVLIPHQKLNLFDLNGNLIYEGLLWDIPDSIYDLNLIVIKRKSWTSKNGILNLVVKKEGE